VWVGGIPFKKLAAESVAMTNIMEHPPANVKFPGLMKREDVVAYYQAADVFFLPSAQETFGIVIVEAAAAGLPVLLRDLEQYRDTFGNGYEKGTDETFGAIIERFRTDRKYYDKWAEAAKSIADRYDAQRGASTLMKVYVQLMGGKVVQQKTEA
jgi:1,2-diacylglycerol-3-alpha-glucose alpha-1,2-galactosyltransferase